LFKDNNFESHGFDGQHFNPKFFVKFRRVPTRTLQMADGVIYVYTRLPDNYDISWPIIIIIPRDIWFKVCT